MRTFDELKTLSENDNFKKVLDELKVKGLDSLFDSKIESNNYIELFLKVLLFFDNNKNIFKNVDSETKEDILVLCIDEILERNDIFIDETEIEQNLQLLKNSFIVQEGFELLYDILVSLIKNVRGWFKSKFKKTQRIKKHERIKKPEKEERIEKTERIKKTKELEVI